MRLSSGRAGAIGLGLTLAAFAEYWALGIAGGGHGWVVPFFLSPVLFVLNPVAFDLVLRAQPRLSVVTILLAIAVVSDCTLIFATQGDEPAYFWKDAALFYNLDWVGLWVLWQVAALVAMMCMARG